jgi:hypothetical protein
MNIVRKATLAAVLGATVIAGASPAMARDGYRGRDNGDTAAAAIVGGVIGIALGAIIASDNNNDNDRRYRDGYYPRDGYYQRDGYYYRDGRRYSQREWNRNRSASRDGYYNRRGYRNEGYYSRGY